jgi:uncharacterized protein
MHLETATAWLNTKPKPWRVCLDTNVCLHLWWFKDHYVQWLQQSFTKKHLSLVQSPAMLDELATVLQRENLGANQPGLSRAILDQIVQLNQPVDRAAPTSALLCSDPDDQMFIDWLHAGHVEVLISLDRQVLKLARRSAANRWGLILTPHQAQTSLALAHRTNT